VFGAIVLIGLFAFAFLAGSYLPFICNSFKLLTAVFSLGAALSASLLSAGASVQGQLGEIGRRFPLIY
jgi:hypothetical protein